MKTKAGLVSLVLLLDACSYDSRTGQGIAEEITKASEAWRELNSTELVQGGWRSTSSTNFASVSLDIDGDRLPDDAAIVVSSDEKQSGIRVCFGSRVPHEDCIIVAAEQNVATVMGLEKRKPGCYSYMQADFESVDRHGRVCSKGDVLEYFRFGSSGSFFVYDERAHKLHRYWDSD